MKTISPASVVAAAGLVGGFAAARYSGRREVGGALFTIAGAYCSREWRKSGGTLRSAALSTLYTGAMGGSHPLAKKVGPWPAVLGVTAATVAASELLGRKRT